VVSKIDKDCKKLLIVFVKINLCKTFDCCYILNYFFAPKVLNVAQALWFAMIERRLQELVMGDIVLRSTLNDEKDNILLRKLLSYHFLLILIYPTNSYPAKLCPFAFLAIRFHKI